MIEIIRKHKQLINYVIFGVLTTLINIISYEFFTYLNINYLVSNIFAWIISVLFAFITNKLFVFSSAKNLTLKIFIFEFLKFCLARVFTGAVDMGIMFIFVSILLFNDTLVKIFANILVIILNFILSKLFVFKNKK